MKRRTLLAETLAFVGTRSLAQDGSFEITRSKAERQAILTEAGFAVMRAEETETPYTSPLNDAMRAEFYHCKGCDLPAYSSEHKYDNGTGWPSFWRSLPDAVRTKPDNTLFAI